MQHPRRTVLCLTIAATLATSLLAGVITTIHVEATGVRISHSYGTLYPPVMVMANEHLLEKQAKAAGLSDMKASYHVLNDSSAINDAMPSSALDIASLDVPGFLMLWDKVRDGAMEVHELSSLSSSSIYLITRNPNVETLTDFFNKGRIAILGIKTSLPAVVPQMTTAKTFGDKQFNKLDPVAVPLSHPDATIVMLTDDNQINSYMAPPPFSHTEAAAPGLHRVLNTANVLNNITLDMTYTSEKFYETNPKLPTAFMAVLDETNTLIAKGETKAA